MKRLAIISHNSFRAFGFQKSRSPSSPDGPAPQGSQLITLDTDIEVSTDMVKIFNKLPCKQKVLKFVQSSNIDTPLPPPPP